MARERLCQYGWSRQSTRPLILSAFVTALLWQIRLAYCTYKPPGGRSAFAWLRERLSVSPRLLLTVLSFNFAEHVWSSRQG